jgi:Spy/CpxP family protein refolding chaperone
MMRPLMTAFVMGCALAAAAPAAADAAAEARPEHRDPFARLAERLNLTADQSAKLKPVFQRHFDEMKALRRSQRDLIHRLRDLVEDRADDAKIAPVLKELKDSQKAADAARARLQDEAERVLTPTQQAKFVIEFADRMGRAMREGRERPPHDH